MTTQYVITSKDVFHSYLIFADENLYACRNSGTVQDSFNDQSIPLKEITFRTPTKDKQLYDIFNAPHNRFVVHSYLNFHVNNNLVIDQFVITRKQGASQGSSLNAEYVIKLHCRTKDACLKLLMIHHLQHHVHARLGKSNFGVGVFAIRDIPKDMPIFDNLLTKCATYRPVRISNTNVKSINSKINDKSPITNLLADFFLAKGKQITYPVPVYGPNSIDTSFYLNHSETPNLKIVYPNDCDMSVYVAAEPIVNGEELSIDYRTFGFTDEEIHARMPFLPQNKRRCV